MMYFRSALGLTSVRIALAVSALLGLGCTLLPLLNVFSVDSAMVFGLVLPPCAAMASASMTSGLRAPLSASLRLAWLLWCIPAAILGLHAFFGNACDPYQGLIFHALGPCVGVSAAAICGVALGRWFSPRRAIAFAGALPFIEIGYCIYLFWATPAIFFYGHFFGFFPGTLYDRGTSLASTYWAFRGVSLAMLGCVVLLGSARDRYLGRLNSTRAVVGAVALLVLLGTTHFYGPHFGFSSSSSYIAARLGRTLTTKRCVVHFPKELTREEAARHRDDCEFRSFQAERSLGVNMAKRTHAFLFRSADEKRALMGAEGTHIAKPWRHEVYLQLDAWPHPILAHEIVHVVAGAHADLPWKVAGGILPDPALIEGTAVAVAWDIRHGFTPHEWSQALYSLGRLPPLRRVLGGRFLGFSPELVYTTMGSFMRFLLDTRGPGPLAKAYRTGDIPKAYGITLNELENRWLDFLRHLPRNKGAEALAGAYFNQEPIFTEICSRELASLRENLHESLASGDTAQTLRIADKILSVDRNDLSTQLGRIEALSKTTHAKAVVDAVKSLENRKNLPVIYRERAHEFVADGLWKEGDFKGALLLYNRILSQTLPDDTLRRVQVKALALEAGPPDSDIVLELLVESRALVSSPTAVYLMTELANERADGLGQYLIGRQLFQSQDYGRAQTLFSQARERSYPTETIAIEATRLEGISSFAVSDMENAKILWNSLKERDDISSARRAEARDWLERIDFHPIF